MHAWNTNAESSMPGLEMRKMGAMLLVQRWPPVWRCKIGWEPKCITLEKPRSWAAKPWAMPFEQAAWAQQAVWEASGRANFEPKLLRNIETEA